METPISRPMKHQLLTNLTKYEDRPDIAHRDYLPLIRSLTEAFITKYGDELFVHSKSTPLTEPASPIDMKNVLYSASIPLETFQDNSAKDVDEFAKHVEILVDAIYEEIKIQMSTTEKRYHPYLLMTPGNLWIDPHTFTPRLQITGQYALL